MQGVSAITAPPARRLAGRRPRTTTIYTTVYATLPTVYSNTTLYARDARTDVATLRVAPSQRRTACRADSRCRTVPGLRCPAPREKARATIYALVRATRQHGGAAGGGRSGWCHCVVLRLGLQ